MKLAGSRWLVTGCSSGIGRALASALYGAGAVVWATARDPGSLDALASQGLHTAALDVTDDRAVREAVAQAEPLDGLVNNAGYGLVGAVEEISDDELLAQFDVNLFGLWRTCRAVLPGMRGRGAGAIVNVSSFGGQAAYPGIGAYRSSKFALEGFSWTLHLEVAHFGIRVLDVQPGLTSTDFGTRSLKTARRLEPDGPYAAMRASADRAYERMSPEAMTPEAVAEAVVAELARDSGPLHLRLGVDTKRVLAAMAGGDEAYERFLTEELGFDWHPRRSG